MNIRTILGQLRLLAILEGISYLLLGITVPLKYSLDMGMPNKIVGMIHGILFIAYCVWVVVYSKEARWKSKRTAICLLASIVPFATFFVEVKILKSEKSEA